MIKYTNKQKTVFVLSAISLALSVGLSTFVVNGEVNDVSSVHESDATFEKVCINKTKNKEYASLNYAMNEAEANDEIYVYPGNDQKRNEITIISDLVIKEGVSLYVPYKTDENGNYVIGETTTSTPNDETNPETSDGIIISIVALILGLAAASVCFKKLYTKTMSM